MRGGAHLYDVTVSHEPPRPHRPRRSLGAKSPLYDYLRALPETTDAPLMWSEQELEEIR